MAVGKQGKRKGPLALGAAVLVVAIGALWLAWGPLALGQSGPGSVQEAESVPAEVSDEADSSAELGSGAPPVAAPQVAAPAGVEPQGTPPAGMTISGPGNILVGDTFQITIAASPAPAVPLTGVSTEVLLPAGLKWQPRAACGDELLARSSGSALIICIAAAGPNGEVRHVGASGVVPPLPPLDTPLTAILEIDVLCNTAGSYKVALTGLPAAFGAAYFDANSAPIGVTMTPQDIDVDGDTTPDFTEVASATTVECKEPTATPTNTATPTETPVPPTATNTPTPTPCGFPGPTCTPSPTPTTTNTPTVTNTPTITVTPTVTETPMATDTPTATETPESEPGADAITPADDLSPIVGPDTGTGGGSGPGAGAGFVAAMGALLVATMAGLSIYGWRRYGSHR